MRCICITLLLALSVVPTALGADSEEEIRAAEKGWAEAVVSLDFGALEKIYHQDLIYAHSSGVIETKSEYMGKLRSGRQKYDVIEHHETKIVSQGDGAVTHSIVTMKGQNSAGPFDNRLMLIHAWFKIGGSWRLAAHQTTQLEK